MRPSLCDLGDATFGLQALHPLSHILTCVVWAKLSPTKRALRLIPGILIAQGLSSLDFDSSRRSARSRGHEGSTPPPQPHAHVPRVLRWAATLQIARRPEAEHAVVVVAYDASTAAPISDNSLEGAGYAHILSHT